MLDRLEDFSSIGIDQKNPAGSLASAIDRNHPIYILG